eukprot:TRINITY_DN15810_c0_g1_i1.p1 TRINITY_DN15810_c0_g1~~TRINITY_DN15810_c0_g1_i1.p1  ORF type:complete len:262 (+),score=89.70 TRINITY_DN15810_c0_g1_i1:82-786(+)
MSGLAELLGGDVTEAAGRIVAALGKEHALRLRDAITAAAAAPASAPSPARAPAPASPSAAAPAAGPGRGGGYAGSPVSQKAKEKAEKAKSSGNKAFQSGDHQTALRHYNLAVNLDPSSEVYLSNRSAAYAGLQRWNEALADAHKAVDMAPQWPKGYLRVAAALQGQRFYFLAAEAYRRAVALDGSNEKARQQAEECEQLGQQSGFKRADEQRTLLEQQDEEKRRQLSGTGCAPM